MKNALILARKDALSYFQSWTGVLILFFFSVLGGVFFFLPALAYSQISLSTLPQDYQHLEGLGITRFVFGSFFINIATILIFIVPFLSMRSFAEERNRETLELLFTYPLSDFEVVVGKLFGMLGFFVFLCLPTAAYIYGLQRVGADMDWGPILTGYLGFWLLANAYLALGLFISSLSENPVVSAVVTFSLLVVFWLLEWVAGASDGTWARWLAALSPFTHYREFTIGILDLSHLVYFIFFQFYFLFLTMRAIEARNWKG